jgi:hypothetical protein
LRSVRTLEFDESVGKQGINEYSWSVLRANFIFQSFNCAEESCFSGMKLKSENRCCWIH